MSKIPKDVTIPCRIYILICPINYTIRYVGKTVKSVEYRLTGHIYDSKRGKTHKSNWIKRLTKQGLKPYIVEIDCLQWNKSQEREKYWIKFYKDLGFDLCNHTIGGEGTLGRKVSKKTRLKASKSMPKKEVFCYTKDGKFVKRYNSIHQAALKTGSRATKIVACCKGKRKHHNDYIWSYTKIKDFKKAKLTIYKVEKIKDGQIIETFNSFKEATEKGSITKSKLIKITNNETKNNTGFEWKIYRK